MNTLGWGVIGIGRIVETTMAPALVEEPACDLVAGVSRDQGRADAFAARFGARFAYTNYSKMLANPEVEAVFIATPNALHADQVVEAAAAGKHVLCDKPLATNVDDAVRAVEACADAGVKLGINFHNRRLPWVNDVKDMIAAGRIGDVTTIHVEASAGLNPPKDWRLDPELAGLGTVYNQGTHVFDFLRYILGSDPIEVAAMFDDQNGAFQVETKAMMLFHFSNGTHCFLNINQSEPYPQNSITFFGTEGRIDGRGLTRSRFDGELAVVTADGETTESYPQPSGLAHRRNIAAFTESVLAGEEPNSSGIDGLHSALLCDALARSVTERRIVEVDYTQIAG